MAQQVDPISTLQSGFPQGTDLTPATDTQDKTQAATGTTKKYLRSDEFDFYFSAVGIKTVEAVFVATTTPLLTIYNNGTGGLGATLTNNGTMGVLIIDGVQLALNQRVLVWQQTNSAQNGIYSVTNTGTSLIPWVLTRTTDYDTPAQVIQGQIVLVQQGNTLAGRSYQQTAAAPFVIGTSAIMFVQFNILTSMIVTLPDWISITASTANLVPGSSYIANNTGLGVTFYLPVSSAVGKTIQIVSGTSTSWSIAQNTGQNIRVGNITSTIGVTGSWSSNDLNSSISMVNIAANNTWIAYSSTGNLLYT